ncbi:MAG: lytic transglycosylase domain-containing protein [Actinomycetota bacterium]
MTRASISLAIVGLLLVGACSEPSSGEGSSDPIARSTEEPTPTPAPSPTPEPEPGEEVFLPDPNRGIPARPGKIAGELRRVHDALKLSVKEWRTEGTPATGRPPKPVVYQALYQQRLLRRLVKREAIARKTIRRLDGALRNTAVRVVRAQSGLSSLVRPLKPKDIFKTQRPEPAGVLRRFYRRAQRRFGVHWYVLASVNYIESKFGRVKSNSYAGAQGPMQFLPSTWEAYGLGGNIRDPRDAIMGAANYLSASGAPNDYRRALYAYNHSDAYVDAILAYAREMKSNERNYYVLYNWQVYVATTKGTIRITGPGL